jgi:hypothetical protein
MADVAPASGNEDADRPDDGPTFSADQGEQDTWTGDEVYAVDPSAPSGTGSEISVRDRMALKEQRQRHILQLSTAGGIAVMTLSMLVITLAFGAAHSIDEKTVDDIIHTLIAPMVVSGMIAIIAWLFNNNSK